MKHETLLESWGTAFYGVFFALKHQKNIRLLVVISVIIAAISPFLRLSAGEYMVLSITVSLVFVAELINSGLEYAIDLVTEEYHELAKAAKDMAAAAVLVACVNAIVVAAIWAIGRAGWLEA